jgi:phosphatidylinositol alpha 1,6-mannosyltransferase
MADERLHQIFQQRETTQGDDLFGEYNLVAEGQRERLAPIKRVAVLTEAFLPKVDGVSKTTYLTIRYLQETGREVLIFAPDTAVPRVGDSEVVNLPSFTLQAASETRVALPIPAITKRIAEFQPDLVHLASPAVMTIAGMAAGRELNVPVVANYQTDLPGYAAYYGAKVLERPVRNWLRYLHNGCHINLVPSNTVMEELREHHFRRMRIWSRGVNIDRFNPAKASDEMRQRLLNGRDNNNMLVVYLGRLANEKSVDLLREVADIPNVALTIIGDGHQREALEELFAGTGTHFTGYMYGEDLSTALASADAFFFAGGQETFGQVVREAMASGLPAVVTNRGSVKDLVRDGETGFVVEHNAEAFAQAAKILANDRERLKQMSIDARQAAEKHPWSSIFSQLEEYYKEAYTMNQRFVNLFGKTTYHTTALPAGILASVGTFIASQIWRK